MASYYTKKFPLGDIERYVQGIDWEFLLGWRTIAAGLLVYWTLLGTYRLWIHPIAAVPGPRWAAITYAWQWYWDIWKDGCLVKQLPALHEKYGRVVRISPNEVHIRDMDAYAQIYKSNTKFMKSPTFYNGFGFPTSLFALRDPHLHKIRKQTLGPLFSKSAVDNLAEGIIQSKLELLTGRWRQFAKERKPIPVQNAFFCFTLDTIATYCFGNSFNMLDTPGFEGEIVDNVLTFTDKVWMIVHFPWIQGIAALSPGIIGPLLAKGFISYRTFCDKVVKDFYQVRKSKISKAKNRDTIFDVLLDPEQNKNKRAPDFNELVDEAMSLITGGTDSTAETLTAAIWYFNTELDCKRKLIAELDGCPRDDSGRLTLATVQQLPYLTAFIKETLRCHHGAPGRHPRVVPKEGLTVPSDNTFLPAGTVVGVSHAVVHRDPENFEDPWVFRPERWLVPLEDRPERYLLSFSRGTRACTGISVAWAEMHLALANLFSDFDMVLYETIQKDVEWCDHAALHLRGKVQIKVQERHRG